MYGDHDCQTRYDRNIFDAHGPPLHHRVWVKRAGEVIYRSFSLEMAWVWQNGEPSLIDKTVNCIFCFRNDTPCCQKKHVPFPCLSSALGIRAEG